MVTVRHRPAPSPPLTDCSLRAQHCAGCVASSSVNCSCTVLDGLGGFWTNGTYDASLEGNPYHYFNWHPLLMTLAFVLFYLYGAVAYRLLPPSLGITRKWIHGTVMCTATSLSIGGVVAVFRYHDAVGDPNLYTLHSIVGLATVVLFALQFFCGLYFFALQKNGALRARMIAAHRMVGTMLGAFTAGAILTGVMDEQKIMLGFGDDQGLPSTDDDAPAIVFSDWWMLVLGCAAATVYHLLYDQTEKVKAVLKAQGVLPESRKPLLPTANGPPHGVVGAAPGAQGLATPSPGQLQSAVR